jgi:hypothetical protein
MDELPQESYLTKRLDEVTVGTSLGGDPSKHAQGWKSQGGVVAAPSSTAILATSPNSDRKSGGRGSRRENGGSSDNSEQQLLHPGSAAAQLLQPTAGVSVKQSALGGQMESCSVCMKILRLKSLRAHLLTHEIRDCLPCSECGKQFMKGGFESPYASST